MRKLIGALCILLGIACLFCAVGFVFYNQWEADNAEEVSKTMLKEIEQIILDKAPEESEKVQETVKEEDTLTEVTETVPTEMATALVGDDKCIGILSIPVLELELPVLTDWSYEKLKKAPCHYYGNYYEKDFVIAAHNYKGHFGRLSQLQAGDVVIFTDVNGNKYYYEVVLLETLSKMAISEMITSGFDLSLYTCTTGGGSRVTVRCNAIDRK